MQLSIAIDMLFDLLSQQRLTASYFSEKYALSPRTVYRYVDLLAASVPIHIQRGRNGGIRIADNFKLPVGFMTKEEYDAASEALTYAYENTAELRFLRAKRKLNAQEKTERAQQTIAFESSDVVIDSRFFGDVRTTLVKLRILESGIREKRILETQRRLPNGTLQKDKIEPHLLGLIDNVWKAYVFSHRERNFSVVNVGDIFSFVKTEEYFRKRPFPSEHVFYSGMEKRKTISARLAIADEALSRAQACFGAERRIRQDGVWIAEVTLPDDPNTIERIVSFGIGIKILSPPSLQKSVLRFLDEVRAQHEPPSP